MKPQPWTVRLFQRALMVWVIGFTLSAYWGWDAMYTMGRSPVYAPPGLLKYVTHGLALLPNGIGDVLVLALVPLLVLLCVFVLFRGSSWWVGLLIWIIHLNLMNRAWLAGSGGQQLIANLLFWNIFLPSKEDAFGVAATSAFWIIRLQLLLAYLATGLHKLTGIHWLDGTAVGIAATDPAFGPLWIADHPALAMVATWCVLLFQLTFPIAVWFRSTRLIWMGIGVVFHLGTAIWMDIPEMGLAFIAAYAIWLDEDTFARFKLKRPSTMEAGSMVG